MPAEEKILREEIKREVEEAVSEDTRELGENNNNNNNDGYNFENDGFFFFNDDKDWSEKALLPRACITQK